jgi:arginyl-tRNA synthetase
MGWHTPPTTRCEHMGFGVVLGEDGKRFRTRSGDTVKLKELLDEGRDRALEKIKERILGHSKEDKEEKEEGEEATEDEKYKGNITYLSEAEYLEAAEKMGMAAIKYYDLR